MESRRSGGSGRTWVRVVARLRQRQKESPTDRAARLTADATVALAIFTVVLAATSVMTVFILKNQLEEMHSGGVDTHALAESTNRVSQAALRSQLASERFATAASNINTGVRTAVDKLNAQAINSSRIAGVEERQSQIAASALEEERPWVGPRGFTLVYDSSRRIQGVIIPMLNGGRSTAIHVRSVLRFSFGHPEVLNIDLGAPKSDVCGMGPLTAEFGDLMLLPGAPVDVPVRLTDSERKRVDDVYADKVALFVVGCVDYSDASGEVHRTAIRERFFPHADVFQLTPDENLAN